MMPYPFSVFLNTIFGVLVFSFSLAQEEAIKPHPNPLTISSKQVDTAIYRYQKNPITIKLSLIDGYKAYLDQFQLKSTYPSRMTFSSLKVTPSIVFYDKFFHKEREGFVGQGELSAQFELPKDIRSGPQIVKALLVYQACTEDFCLLPKNIEFSFHVNVPEDKNEQTIFSFNQAFEKGLVWVFLLVFVAGFLTSLTPCVFPMIPITLSILGTQVIGQSRLRGFALSLCYVLGVGITYASLGVIAAQTGGLFGSVLANPVLMIGIAILFVLMGLGMYGAFDIQLPEWIRYRLAKYQVHQSLGGVFVAGLISGVVASPCISPVLIGILTYVAQTQDVILGFFLLFVFAMGLGVLFLLLGTFSQCLNFLPKSGLWMEGVKLLFGTTMMAMAFYYLYPVLPAIYFKGLLGLTCLLLGGLFCWHTSIATAQMSNMIKKSLLIVFCLIGICIWSFAFLAHRAFNDDNNFQKNDNVVLSKEEKSHWQPFTDELFQEGLAQNRPIIIDFTAQWCGVCKALETQTFADLDVKIASKEFLLLTIDATLETKDVAKWIADFQVLGLPTVLFYNRQGVLQKDLTLTSFEDPSAFLKRMKKVLEPKE